MEPEPLAVAAVGVDGGVNTPGKDPQGADGEVRLDIGVTVTAAAGDSGSSDTPASGSAVAVDFPGLQPPRAGLRWHQPGLPTRPVGR